MFSIAVVIKKTYQSIFEQTLVEKNYITDLTLLPYPGKVILHLAKH